MDRILVARRVLPLLQSGVDAPHGLAHRDRRRADSAGTTNHTSPPPPPNCISVGLQRQQGMQRAGDQIQAVGTELNLNTLILVYGGSI